MSISVIDESGFLDSSLRAMARRRLLFALSRYDSRIAKVEMRVSGESMTGLTGAKSGHGTICRVSVTFNGGNELQISDRDEDLAKCIALIAERVGREVGRVVEQTQRFERSRRMI